MRCKLVILIFALAVVSVEVSGQIKEGSTYQFFTCKDRTETYVYYGGTSDPNKIYCPVNWTVTGGVFVDALNPTSSST